MNMNFDIKRYRVDISFSKFVIEHQFEWCYYLVEFVKND
mgnify:CR=1 FL=1